MRNLRTAMRVLVAALLSIGACEARAGMVTITVDDLPIYGRPAPPIEAEAITSNLLAGFARHRWRVTGFVNEIQLEDPDRAQRTALLAQWLDAGMDLGNHGYSHLSLTSTPVEAYIADVAKGDAVTRPLMAAHGQVERWYRHPYLETGPTLAVRQRFEHWLHGFGYRVAPVSMENADWQFGDAYDDALARHDDPGAAHIRRAYLAYTARIIPWYIEAATGLLGREPAFVLLLHASRLNAATVDRVAAILHANHLRAVTLDRAMRDPAYRIPDHHVGPDGDEWVSRWAETLHRQLPFDTFPEVPADIAAAEQRLQAADAPSASPSPAR